MDVVTDASAFLAVILSETDRNWVIRKTLGKTIVSPDVLPYEIGNALFAMKKRRQLSEREVLRAFDLSQKINVRLLSVRIREALKISIHNNIYAYDAYYLQCCLENKLSLISLDKRMCSVAGRLGIKVVE